MAEVLSAPVAIGIKQELGDGGDDPNGGNNGDRKLPRGHAVEGNTQHSRKIAAAQTLGDEKKGEASKKSTYEGVMKGTGMAYKTTAAHRANSAKWHRAQNETLKRCTRKLNSILPRHHRITEAQVDQVSGKAGRITLIQGAIATIQALQGRATADTSMTTGDGSSNDNAGDATEQQNPQTAEGGEQNDDGEDEGESGESSGDEKQDGGNTTDMITSP